MGYIQERISLTRHKYTVLKEDMMKDDKCGWSEGRARGSAPPFFK
jgi:hypothetical protein